MGCRDSDSILRARLKYTPSTRVGNNSVPAFVKTVHQMVRHSSSTLASLMLVAFAICSPPRLDTKGKWGIDFVLSVPKRSKSLCKATYFSETCHQQSWSEYTCEPFAQQRFVPRVKWTHILIRYSRCCVGVSPVTLNGRYW